MSDSIILQPVSSIERGTPILGTIASQIQQRLDAHIVNVAARAEEPNAYITFQFDDDSEITFVKVGQDVGYNVLSLGDPV